MNNQTNTCYKFLHDRVVNHDNEKSKKSVKVGLNWKEVVTNGFFFFTFCSNQSPKMD